MTVETMNTDLNAESPAQQESPTSKQADTNAKVARATGVVALGNILSSVLGLAREVVFTNVFGASYAVDAFNVAIIVPKTLYDLLIGGHVNSALVPVLSEVVTRDGQKALWQLVSVLMSLLTVALAVLILLLQFFAPAIMSLIGGGFDARTLELSVTLLRLTAPALLFLGLFAVLSGTLYALRAFSWPALAGAIFNGSIVLITMLFAPPLAITPRLGMNGLNWALVRPAEGITAAAFGWLVGALAQVLLQAPGLYQNGARLRPTLRWRHPALRRLALLYAPVMFSLLMSTFSSTFSYNLASQTGEGSIGYMAWATMLIQFPQGLVATAISIAILPTLARQAVFTSREGMQAFKDTLGLGLRLAITLIVPAAVGLFVLATPIIMLLFQHGAFTPHDTAVTTLALRLYLIGLPFAAVDLLLVYAFYARQDTLTPALIGLLSLALYMVAVVALIGQFGLFSLMIADSLKHMVHAVASAVLLTRRINGLGGQRLVSTILKAGLAALVMGVAASVITPLLAQVLPGDTLIQEILLVSGSGIASILVFLTMASLIQLEELRWLAVMLKQRLGKVV